MRCPQHKVDLCFHLQIHYISDIRTHQHTFSKEYNMMRCAATGN